MLLIEIDYLLSASFSMGLRVVSVTRVRLTRLDRLFKYLSFTLASSTVLASFRCAFLVLAASCVHDFFIVESLCSVDSLYSLT